MKILSELGEAVEAVRKDNFSPYEFKKDSFEDEIADTVIRLFDLAGAMDFNLGVSISDKMKYNKTRPYKHGKTV